MIVLSSVFMTCFAFTFNYIKNMFPGYTAWRDLQTCLENTWITRHPHETPPPPGSAPWRVCSRRHSTTQKSGLSAACEFYKGCLCQS